MAAVLSKSQVNKMMLDQINSGDDANTVACRWLQDNKSQELWTEWLPDTSKCFAQFGLWNAATEEFVADRASDKSFLECRACESGRYSEKLKDKDGETYICTLCPTGTSQPSGAALQCEPCMLGEYQDKTGQTSCKRCIIGQYQDQKGQERCIPCIDGTTTLGDGRPSVEDCGCIEGKIDIGEGGNRSICIACGEGMICPFSSTEHSLLNGSAKNGPDFVPAILEGYYRGGVCPTTAPKRRPCKSSSAAIASNALAEHQTHVEEVFKSFRVPNAPRGKRGAAAHVSNVPPGA